MAYTFAHGTGTAADPYLVETADDLNGVRDYLDAHFKQMADIDLSAYENWEPIGEDADGKRFTGIYDGNRYTVNNLMINTTNHYKGLFGVCDTATINNLGVMNANIQGGNQGAVLVGKCTSSTLTNCYTTGNVRGLSNIGGLVGYNHTSKITNCYSMANVTGTNNQSGGLVGYSISSSIIENCYSTGNVTGYNYCGGFVGCNHTSKITNCYSIGAVSANKYFSGFVGYIYSSTIISSYYDSETSGYSDTGKGTPKTTAEMKQQETFAGWDFDTVWAMDSSINDGYPYLLWQVTDATPRKILPITYPAKYPMTYPN